MAVSLHLWHIALPRCKILSQKREKLLRGPRIATSGHGVHNATWRKLPFWAGRHFIFYLDYFKTETSLLSTCGGFVRHAANRGPLFDDAYYLWCCRPNTDTPVCPQISGDKFFLFLEKVFYDISFGLWRCGLESALGHFELTASFLPSPSPHHLLPFSSPIKNFSLPFTQPLQGLAAQGLAPKQSEPVRPPPQPQPPQRPRHPWLWPWLFVALPHSRCPGCSRRGGRGR